MAKAKGWWLGRPSALALGCLGLSFLAACGEVANTPLEAAGSHSAQALPPGELAPTQPEARPELGASQAESLASQPEPPASLALSPAPQVLPSATPAASSPASPSPSPSPRPLPLGLSILGGSTCLGDTLVAQGTGFPGSEVRVYIASDPLTSYPPGALPFGRYVQVGQVPVSEESQFTLGVELRPSFGPDPEGRSLDFSIGAGFQLVARYEDPQRGTQLLLSPVQKLCAGTNP